MKRRRERKGFTLLELLVVVIIVGILASIAIPQFVRIVEKGKTAEASSILGAIFTAESAYYQENNKYVAAAPASTVLSVDIPVDNEAAHYFKYNVTSASATTFTGTATRKSPTDTGKDAGYTPTYTITIDQTGKITATGP